MRTTAVPSGVRVKRQAAQRQRSTMVASSRKKCRGWPSSSVTSPGTAMLPGVTMSPSSPRVTARHLKATAKRNWLKASVRRAKYVPRRRTVSSTHGSAYSATTATVPSTRARVISALGAPTREAGGPGCGDGATRPVSRLSLVRHGPRMRGRGGRAPAGRRDHAPSSFLSEEALGPDDEHDRHQQELEDQREPG